MQMRAYLLMVLGRSACAYSFSPFSENKHPGTHEIDGWVGLQVRQLALKSVRICDIIRVHAHEILAGG
jgi:hypothetical protein